MFFGCESALITLYAERRYRQTDRMASMYKVKRASNTYSFYLHWDNGLSSSRQFVSFTMVEMLRLRLYKGAGE